MNIEALGTIERRFRKRMGKIQMGNYCNLMLKNCFLGTGKIFLTCHRRNTNPLNKINKVKY